MNENERFTEVLNYLIENKKVRNQQEFTEKVGSNKTTVSQIKNGETKIPNNLFGKITEAFPIISFDWLKKGEGEMLKDVNNINSVNGNGNTSVAGNGNQITNANITELLEMLRISQNQLSESQSHINKLLGIIEQLNSKIQ
ncbi:MAG: hypothetical protein LBP85_10625 [Prevotellaceae bacterium]|jgi:transcriptional regulator with XRE-family HTH domain|nr:hypothetical protein [Prevotellaceae bacterium]